MGKPILCVDFDGVLHAYTSGWKGAKIIADGPVPGAMEFLVKATEYFEVCIYSARSSQWGGKRAMKRWLYDQYAQIGGVEKTGWPSPFIQFRVNPDSPEIPKWYYSHILNSTSMEPWEYEVDWGIKRFLKQIKFPTKKPPAFLTIDDRAICFEGVFPNPKELLSFKPWNNKGV